MLRWKSCFCESNLVTLCKTRRNGSHEPFPQEACVWEWLEPSTFWATKILGMSSSQIFLPLMISKKDPMSFLPRPHQWTGKLKHFSSADVLFTGPLHSLATGIQLQTCHSPCWEKGFMSSGAVLWWHGNASPSQPRMWAQLTRLPAKLLLDGVFKLLCKNYSSSVWGCNCHARALNWPVYKVRNTPSVSIHKNWAQITSLVTRKTFGGKSCHRLQPSKVQFSCLHKDSLLYHLHPLALFHLTTYVCLSTQHKFCPRE